MTRTKPTDGHGLSVQTDLWSWFVGSNRPIWRRGLNTRLLGKRSQVRSLHEHVCFYWVCVFSYYLFTEKYRYKYNIHYLDYLVTSAYFQLDNRDCV
jgi:hypothetical protein